MKYGVWFVRLVFAGWMIPAGLNHFIPLFAQPLGSQHLSRELFTALWDSSLFDYVKLVELIAGLGALTMVSFSVTTSAGLLGAAYAAAFSSRRPNAARALALVLALGAVVLVVRPLRTLDGGGAPCHTPAAASR